jgi:hypothetical protein
MGFLSPWLLGGLAALSLPVWLHLLRRHKSTPLPFSSLMFFEQRTQASVKHRRLDHLLLLALRLLLFALLVFAFAQPFLMSSLPAASSDGKLMLLVLDESASMGHEDRMDRARKEAQGVISSLRAKSRGQVASFASHLKMLTQPTNDFGQLRAAVQGIEAGPERSSLGELARALRAYSESAHEPVEVHLFSDLQKTSLPSAFSEVQLGPGTTLVIHPAADGESSNWAVETVKAPRRLLDPAKAKIQATLVSYAKAPAERRVVLAAGGKEVAAKTVTIPAGARVPVEFLGLNVPYGLSRCEVRLDPPDHLKADDHFLFAVERSDPRKVLFLYGPRAERSILYFESALESAAENAYAVEAIPANQASSGNLDRYAFVVLSDVADLSEPLEAALRNYVETGGGVWIALGVNAATRPHAVLSGEAILESRYASRAGERFQMVDSADETHPSFRQSARWAGVKFYQAVAVRPAKSHVIATLSDQTPILLEQTVGEGRLLLFASGLDNLANDFPLHPSFVPFVEQTANYLAGQEDRSTMFSVGSFLDLRQGQSRAAAVEVLDPAGKRALGLSEAAKAQTLPLNQEGFYEVRRGGGRQELIAVNIDRRESDLTPISKDALDLWQGGEASAKQTVSGEAENVKPWPFGRVFLFAAVLAAMFESFIASRTVSAEGA